ncbi:MAG: hypothetical protein LJE62_13930 [Silicimonas sp.]|nr:hypothetical protein [Silicimonas sp.]
MERNSASTSSADIAARIAEFRADELDTFMREHLRKRDLHRVVANLNKVVLSKDVRASRSARKALKRMGFPD